MIKYFVSIVFLVMFYIQSNIFLELENQNIWELKILAVLIGIFITIQKPIFINVILVVDVLQKGMMKMVSYFDKNITRKVCPDCNCIFFTHERDRKLCGSCELVKGNPRYVTKWMD